LPIPQICLLPLLLRYGLADNEDNIPDIIKVGALQRLVDCGARLSVQASKVYSPREALITYYIKPFKLNVPGIKAYGVLGKKKIMESTGST
jgi:hypothetical protein